MITLKITAIFSKQMKINRNHRFKTNLEITITNKFKRQISLKFSKVWSMKLSKTPTVQKTRIIRIGWLYFSKTTRQTLLISLVLFTWKRMRTRDRCRWLRSHSMTIWRMFTKTRKGLFNFCKNKPLLKRFKAKIMIIQKA